MRLWNLNPVIEVVEPESYQNEVRCSKVILQINLVNDKDQS